MFGNNKKKDKKKDLIVRFEDAPFKYQEALNSLRTNLKFISMRNECKKIVVTSSIPNEGKSSIAINLALSLASSGSFVLLIDCDLRKPSLHRYLNIPAGSNEGLTNVLNNLGELESSKIHFIQKGFYVLTSGAIPPNPAEILGSPVMGNFIDGLSKLYDYIIMDTAPVSVVTDAAVLSQYADGVVFVVRQKMVTFEQARQGKKNLDAVNAKILGVVLNDFDMRHVEYESGYYYGYYYNYYGSDSKEKK